MDPRIHLSQLSCKRIAFHGEMIRLVMYAIIALGAWGIAAMFWQYAGAIILMGILVGGAFFFLPRLYSIKLVDVLSSSRDRIKEMMVKHQVIAEQKKREDGYEAKAEKAMQSLDGAE